MTYSNIEWMDLINDTDSEKVRTIANDMRDNGYKGCPILVANDQLITGSHRLAALRILEEDGVDVSDWEVAEDVTELVNEAFARFEEENGYDRDLDLSDIGWMFAGTWVEEYKDEIAEW